VKRLLKRLQRRFRARPKRVLMFGPAPASLPPVSDSLLENVAFQRAFSRASDYIESKRGWSLLRERHSSLPPQGISRAEHYWTQEVMLQASLFQALRETKPAFDAVAGISLGEVPAGNAAGVLTFDDLLHVVGEIIPAVLCASGGDLIAVSAPIDAVRSAIGDEELELILDWPSLNVWALPDAQAKNVHRRLRAGSIAYARLGYNCMSHTHHVNRESLATGLARLPDREFTSPYYSTWKGGRMGSVVSGLYWMRMISERASITGLWSSLRMDGFTDVTYIGSVPADTDLFAALPPDERPTSFVRAEQLLTPVRRNASKITPPLTVSAELLSSQFARDPYSSYRRWRATAGIHYLEDQNAWLVLGYDAITSVLRQPAAFSSTPFKDLSPSLFGADPPAHTRVRRIVASQMTSEKLLELKDNVASTTSRVLDGLRGRTTFDAVADLATPIAMDVAASWLGLRIEHAYRFAQTPPSTMRWIDAKPALSDHRGMLHDLFDEGELSPDEVAEFAAFLVIAGVATVRDLLVFSLYSLLRSEPIRDALCSDSSLVTPFVEEVLRCEPPVHGLIRTGTAEMTIDGVTIPSAATIWLMLAAGNRDPEKFERPDEFLLNRTGPRHLSFGNGIHYCLGSHLGRVEAEILVDQLLPSLRTMAEHGGGPEFEFSGLQQSQPGIRGMKSWHLAFRST
jgi:cytochrome P450